MSQLPKPPITRTFTTSLKGLVPAPGSSSGRALLDDGSWGSAGDSDTRDRWNVADYAVDRDDLLNGVEDATDAIQGAIDDASAAFTSTGRVQEIYFHGGDYKLLTRVGVNQFDLAGLEGLVFLGAPGKRSRIHQAANAASANWHMFRVQNGATNIEFRCLVLTQQGSSNMPEQAHILHIGEECSDIRVIDCEIRDAKAGDGIRLLGDANGQGSVSDVQISRCRFIDNYRAGVSFQRYTQRVSISECKFWNTVSNNQHIDFEPTGGTFTADGGSGATTIVDAAADFTAMGIVAGDRVYNTTEDVIAYVVSVDSATQLTVSAGATSWAGDSYQFANRVQGHRIVNNDLYGTGNAQILLTLTGDDILVQGNLIQGNIFGLYVNDTTIQGNVIDEPGARARATSATVNFVKDNRNVIIRDNYIKNDGDNSDYGACIQVSHQSSVQPTRAVVENNVLLLRRKGTAVAFNAVEDAVVNYNHIILHTPGETTESIGVAIAAASSMNIAHIECLGNTMRAEQGGFNKGLQINCGGTGTIARCVIGGGSILNTVEPIDLPEPSSGTFTTPPVVHAYITDQGQLTEPPSLPWIQLAGVGGSTVVTNSRRPAVFWGTGNPNTVLIGGVGDRATDRSTGHEYRKLTLDDTNATTRKVGWHSPTAVTTTTSGTLDISSGKTNLSVTGTQSYTLPDGWASGQRMTVVCTVAASTPIGTLTVTTPFSGDPSTYVFNMVGQRLDFEWTGSTWRCLAKLRVGSQTAVLGTDTVSGMVAIVSLSVTGTVNGALPNGAVIGETVEVRCTTAASTPAGTLTGVYRALDATATTNAVYDSTADYLVAQWNGTRWLVLASNGVVFS